MTFRFLIMCLKEDSRRAPFNITHEVVRGGAVTTLLLMVRVVAAPSAVSGRPSSCSNSSAPHGPTMTPSPTPTTSSNPSNFTTPPTKFTTTTTATTTTVSRLQVVLEEQTEIAKNTQEEYERLQNPLAKIWSVALIYHFRMPPYYTLVLRSLASLEGLTVAAD